MFDFAQAGIVGYAGIRVWLGLQREKHRMNDYALILLGMLPRLLPHPPNLAAIGALGLSVWH